MGTPHDGGGQATLHALLPKQQEITDSAQGRPSERHKIRVVVRVRPPISLDGPRASCNLLRCIDQAGVLLQHPTDPKAGREYGFDAVLNSDASQEDVYRQVHVDEMVQAAVAGFNATVFAYGQTGSGKTFTMEGYTYNNQPQGANKRTPNSLPAADIDNTPAQQLGLVPRALKALFAAVSASSHKTKTCVNVSFVQLYNEQAYDLLNPAAGLTGSGQARGTLQDGFKPGQPLRMRWSQQQEFYLENLFQVQCGSSDEALSVFMKGVRAKVMAAHQMNNSSSRSHTVLNLHLHSHPVTRPDEVVTSCLTLVDLAGSERSAATGATQGVLRDEGIAINKSLFTLRQVIVALAVQTVPNQAGEAGPGVTTEPTTSTAHVPYRDSKLTALLKRSLGGNSLTTMIACVSSIDMAFEENMRTLDYAALARKVVNKVHVNEDAHVQTIRELRAEVAFLRGQLAALQLNPHSPGGVLVPALPAPMVAIASAPHSNATVIQPASPAKPSKLPVHPTINTVTGGEPGNEGLLPTITADLTASRVQDQGIEASHQVQNARPGDTGTEVALARDVRAALTEAVEQDMQMVVQRLQGCAQVITQLTHTNGQLRGAYAGAAATCETLRVENNSLMTENAALRDRIGMLEMMAGVGDGTKGVGSQAVSDAAAMPPASAAALVELQELRQENALLHTLLQIKQSGVTEVVGGKGNVQVLRLDSSQPSRQAAGGPGITAGRMNGPRHSSLQRSMSVQSAAGSSGQGRSAVQGGSRGTRVPSAGKTAAGASSGALSASSNMLSVSQLRAMLSGSKGTPGSFGTFEMGAPAGASHLLSTTGQVLPRASLPAADLLANVVDSGLRSSAFCPPTDGGLHVRLGDSDASQEPAARLAYLMPMRHALARGKLTSSGDPVL